MKRLLFLISLAVLLYGIFEGALGVAQMFGFIDSNHPVFPVTGSFYTPRSVRLLHRLHSAGGAVPVSCALSPVSQGAQRVVCGSCSHAVAWSAQPHRVAQRRHCSGSCSRKGGIRHEVGVGRRQAADVENSLACFMRRARWGGMGISPQSIWQCAGKLFRRWGWN